MKQTVIISIVSLLVGGIIGGGIATAIQKNEFEARDRTEKVLIEARERTEKILNEARNASIEMNKEYNHMYNGFAYYALAGNNRSVRQAAQLSVQTLQSLMPKMLDVNKKLRLDCRRYQNGSPLMVADKDGTSNPLEELPEEIKIMP